MEVNDFVRVKSRDKYGVVLHPSGDRQIGLIRFRSLNTVLLEDNTEIACRDDDLEVINPVIEE